MRGGSGKRRGGGKRRRLVALVLLSCPSDASMVLYKSAHSIQEANCPVPMLNEALGINPKATME